MDEARLLRARLLFEQRRWELAEKELHALLAEHPMAAEAHTLLALCLVQRERFDAAEAAARAAITSAPEEPLCHFAMAQVAGARRRPDDAVRAIEEAIRLDPEEADFPAVLAGIRAEQRRWPDALAAADRALALDPEHVAAGNLRALALRQLGRGEEAAATMAGVLSREPDDATTHANHGWALLEQGEREKALEHFREALRLDPTSDWARAGIVEALKARNIVYGLMLRWFLFMARLSGKAQWGLIIGLYLGAQVLRGIASSNPELAPFVNPLVYAYVGFVFLSWTSPALFNLLLRLDRFGRLALSRDQIMAGNFIGGSVLLAIVFLVAWIATGSSPLGWAALFAATLMLPLAGTFNCDPGWPRWVMIGVTALLALMASAFVAVLVVNPTAKEGDPLLAIFRLALPAYVLGLLGSQILANILAGVRPTR